MNYLSSLILLAPLAACSAAGTGGAVDPDAGGSGDGVGVDASTPVGPDLSCLSQPQPSPTTAVDPMVLAGRVVELTTAGVTAVDAADVALFRAGQPIVLARTNSASNGAFATGAVTTHGNAVHAYLKATKPGYRTAFYYPSSAFTANSTTLAVPMMSDSVFATVKTLLGATQNDARNGALLVGVLDCNGHPLTGMTLHVRRGMQSVGHAYDLGTVLPAATGVFIVFDVPDGKVRVSAMSQATGEELPEHDVVVRASDPECPTSRGTLTSTIVEPSA